MPDKLFGSGPFGEHKQCPVCGEWGWANRHYCSPEFFCRREDDDEEEGVKTFADDEEEAAEKYIEDHFSDFDYPHISTVIVLDPRKGIEYKIDVEVEAVPSFSGSIVEQRPAKSNRPEE